MRPMEIQTEIFTSAWTGNKIMASFRTGTNDKLILKSCIEDDEYQLSKILKPAKGAERFALDLGAHIGGATLMLIDAGYYVMAVEPVPDNVAILQANLDLNDWGNRAEIVQAAAGAGAGSQKRLVWGMPTAPGRDIALERHRFIGGPGAASDRANSLVVATLNIKELLHTWEACEIVKSDCEGGEFEAFAPTAANMEAVQKIKAITGEIHRPRSEFPFLSAAEKYFEDHTERLGLDPSHYVLLLRKDASCSEEKTKAKSPAETPAKEATPTTEGSSSEPSRKAKAKTEAPPPKSKKSQATSGSTKTTG